MKSVSTIVTLVLTATTLVSSQQVDRLISKRYASDASIVKREDGRGNGNDGDNGHNDRGKPKGKKNYEMAFYHINDVHAHLDEFRYSGSSCTDPTKGCVGGYSRVKTVIDQTRPTHENSLFFNAGDEFQGTLFYTIYKGEKIADTLNQLGFDAMTLGNHEFDDGDDLLANFLHNLTFPVVSSNVHTTNQNLASALVPYKIFPKHQLALVAVTTETTKGISSPGNGTTFEDPLTAINRTIALIKRRHRNIKRFAALTHIGYDEDIKLAKASTDISLIMGGHSHTLLGNMTGAKGKYPTIETNKNGEEVFIVQAYRWGEYLGYINTEWQDGRIVKYEGAPFHLTNATAEDPKLKAEIKSWEKAFAPYVNKVLGTTKYPLVQTTCQTGECTLGDFSADAMAAYRPEVDGAIINSGGMRSEIDAGNITQQQALECFPFGNAIAELTFTGADLWTVFEGIASRVNQKNGRAVTSSAQVSKEIRITFNPTNPVGSRLVTLQIGGKPVEATKVYKIATLDFLATGGDNFWDPRKDFAALNPMDQVWSDYVTKMSPIAVELDGRIATTTETTQQKPV
ncbi:5'-nucleotidase [Pyronema omphalodes]|nr:5'-nucleotidase [Pyronema omphalodes]